MLTEAVNQLLAESDLPALLTIEQCAAALAMSATSFRRKLSQEETSFKLIHQKFLNELCVQALLTQQLSIDSLAFKLGYSERATFERAFRKKFGVTPSKFRELAVIEKSGSQEKSLIKIAEQLPPMPDSCQQLMYGKEQNSLDIQSVVDIVSKDPIFSGRLMGLASKAIYGKTPNDLKEAIGRNLGVSTVVNCAIVYAMKDALGKHVSPIIIDRYSEAFMLAPKLFQLIRRTNVQYKGIDFSLIEQVLIFGLLGIFLLAHKKNEKHELVVHSLLGIEDLSSLNQHLDDSIGMSLYSASALMLSLWHIDASVIKQLSHIDKISQKKVKGTESDRLILFMMSCLYQAAAHHSDYCQLQQYCELLGVNCFGDIEVLLNSV